MLSPAFYPLLLQAKSGKEFLKDYYLKYRALSEKDLDDLVTKSSMSYEQVRDWFSETAKRVEEGKEPFSDDDSEGEEEEEAAAEQADSEGEMEVKEQGEEASDDECNEEEEEEVEDDETIQEESEGVSQSQPQAEEQT